MSQRGKRGNHQHHQRLDVEPQPPPTKRRKGRPPNGGGGGGGGIGVASGPGNSITTSNLGSIAPAAGSSISNTNVENHNQNQAPQVADEVIGLTVATATSAKMTGCQGSSSSAAAWQARSVADIKISSIYNRSSTEAPAELYRKDLISAMKLPDSEPLANYEYLVVNDQWKQEWEKGVQVPVNPDSLPEPCVYVLPDPIVAPAHDFKLPKNRFLRITKDDSYSPELHCLTNVVSLAETTCAYDIDQVDEAWLKLLNIDRAYCGAFLITEAQFERVIEELEIRCWEQIQVILKNEEGLGIEYDENVICDVCRSPDSEEANEMVFCDKCNICVHQACYGITAIPSGQWLCRTCSMGIKPECVLCPNKGGAMKSTKSGKNWAHVSCALWIPEVSIGCVDRMEPITKISSIPQSRWALLCVLCRERVGACIQCSVKTCKTAYHVTCAFQHGLEMRAIIEEGNAEDGVKLRSYCHKHSVSKGKKDGILHGQSSSTNKYVNHGSGDEDADCKRRKIRKDMTSEERNQARAQRLQEVEAEFDKHVNIKDISCHLFEVDDDAIEAIYNYWKLKRKSRHNRALIPPKSEDVELIARKQEQQDLENHKLVVHLRQDLERVRNLCYMVSRREKLSRSLFKLREQVFYKQISVLSDENIREISADGAGGNASNKSEFDESFKNAVIYANDGPTLYDRFYSSSSNTGGSAIPSQYQNLDFILDKLLGNIKGGLKGSSGSLVGGRSTIISPIKKKSAATTSSTSAAVSSKGSPSKKVNNGAISVAVTEKSKSTTPNNSRRNSMGATEKVSRANAANTATITAPTLSTRTRGSPRISNSRTLATKNTQEKGKDSDNSTNSSNSSRSSSSDDDSSSEGGGGVSSSVSGFAIESAASYSGSTQSESETQSKKKSSPSKATSRKKQSYSRSVEMRQKQRRRSSTAQTTSKPSAGGPQTSGNTTLLLSSSDDEDETQDNKKTLPAKQKSKSKTSTPSLSTNRGLSQMEKELKKDKGSAASSSSDDSEELLPLKGARGGIMGNNATSSKSTSAQNVGALLATSRKAVVQQIYSDSESSQTTADQDKEERTTESNVSDSQNQQTIRTKAAMKEFTLQQQSSKAKPKDAPFALKQSSAKSEKQFSVASAKTNVTKSSPPDTQNRSNKRIALANNLFSPSNISAPNKSEKTINDKSQKFSADLLVVPQRQAAKKASENMRSTNLYNSAITTLSATALSSNPVISGNSNNRTRSEVSEYDRLRERCDRDNEKIKSKENKLEDKQEKGRSKEKPQSTNFSSTKTADQQQDRNSGKRGRPPKSVKDSPDSGNSSQQKDKDLQLSTKDLISPSRRKDDKLQSVIAATEPSAKSTTFATSEAAIPTLNVEQASQKNASNNSKSHANISKNNILVAYVPQRQAAKKAAEQLKSSGKPTNAAEAASTDEKDRSTSDKDTKLPKTPESNRTRVTPPTRRMSMRDTTVLATAKTPTSSRRRSKDVLTEAMQQQTPKKATDKRRNTSVTSSSESGSNSSSSSDTGSSSSSGSESDEESGHVDECSPVAAIATATVTATITGTASASKRTPRKVSGVERSGGGGAVTRQNSVAKSLKATTQSPQKPLRRNTSTISGESTLIGGIVVETPKKAERSVDLNNRRFSAAEELLKTQKLTEEVSIIVDDEEVNEENENQRRHTKRNKLQSLLQEPAVLGKNNERCSKKSSPEKSSLASNSETIEIEDDDEPNPKVTKAGMQISMISSAEPKTLNLELEIAQRKASCTGSAITTNNSNKNKNKNLGSLDKLLNKKELEISRSNNSSAASIALSAEPHAHSGYLEHQEVTVTADPSPITAKHGEANDERGELPMDIDEELTPAPTNSTLPSNKFRELDIDERPPAAPVPVSPTLSHDGDDVTDDATENEDLSDHINDFQRRGTHRRRRRRTKPGSPPISPEEEHTHHTQHLLNEMELVRALEEERKNELAASASKYSASSSSPAVAVIAAEPPEIIELDSNSNSAQSERLKHELTTTTKASNPLECQQLPPETVTTLATPASQDSSPVSETSSNNKTQHEGTTQNSLNYEANESRNNSSAVDEANKAAALESGHQPIVDTILDMVEENEKQKERNHQELQQKNIFSDALTVSSFQATPIVTQAIDAPDSLEALHVADMATKHLSEEDNVQATRNLLEKLRKTKRNRSDEPKDHDLMMPPTPAIPSVFPFHNAADPDDIFHVQKESAAEASADAQVASNCLFDDGTDKRATPPAAIIQSPAISKEGPSTFLNVSTSTTVASTESMVSSQIASLNSNNQSSSSLPFDTNTLNYLDKSAAAGGPVHISPMQQQHSMLHETATAVSISGGSYNQQQELQTPNVAELSSFLQSELGGDKEQNKKTSSSADCFNKIANSGGTNSATPDFVDLHAAAAAKDSIDFTSTGSVGSNKLVVDCDYDENTRMQSPYTLRATRIWNENDLIAARRSVSTSPSSVSESNDQPSAMELQQQHQQQQQQQVDLPQMQQEQQPHQHTLQRSHLSTNNLGNNGLNARNTIPTADPQNCKSYFNSLDAFGISTPFNNLQQQPQQQQPHHPTSQQQQQSPLVNGIDAMITYNQTFNTPQNITSQQSQQTQQRSQQPATNQFNGLFHTPSTPISSISQIPYGPNPTAATGVLFPATAAHASSVPMSSTATTTQQQQSDTASLYGIGATDPNATVPPNVGGGAPQPQYGAAFTSSSHNMALTAAIVGAPGGSALLDHHSPHNRQLQQQQQNQYNLSSPAEHNAAFTSMLGGCQEPILPPQTPAQQQQRHTTPTKESPIKRPSARYNQQLRNSQKSPQIQHKSPGKSPRQMELLNKQIQLQQQQQQHQQQQQQQQQQQHALTEFTNIPQKPQKYDPLTHTLAGKPRQRAPRGSGAGSRGRGRGRGRGRSNSAANTIIPLPLPEQYGSNTHIVNNLVGTPYEFNYDEDLASPGVENLQSLRDRRRSFDCRSNAGAMGSHLQQQQADRQKYASPTYAHRCKVRAPVSGSNAVVVTTANSLSNCNNSSVNVAGRSQHLTDVGLKTSNTASDHASQQSILHSIVQPVLPGPVDMRTYNLGFEAPHSSASQEAYNNNLLGAFDSGTADQTLSEFDEEDEKEFQSALRATGTTISSKQLPTATIVAATTAVPASLPGVPNSITHTCGVVGPAAGVLPVTGGGTLIPEMVMPADLQTSMETTSEEVSIDSDTTLATKVSLSDSRNQLKLKIKGPLAHPDSYNYNSSSIGSLSLNLGVQAPNVAQSSIGGLVQTAAAAHVTANAVNVTAGGSSNSRRMRKKELLSLYVVQKDTNMDESSCGLPTVETSMASSMENIGLGVLRKTDVLGSGLDEYNADLVSAGNKRSKKTSVRELRSLDSVEINEGCGVGGINNSGVSDGRRRSACSSGSADNGGKGQGAIASVGKRRGRSKTNEGSEDESKPKLKIKIRGLNDGVAGPNAFADAPSVENNYGYDMSRRMVGCPPKKRLTTNYTPPTLEDLKRESMNFRKKVMADFGEDDDERTRQVGADIDTSIGTSIGTGAFVPEPVPAAPSTKRAKSSKPKKDKKEKRRSKDKHATELASDAGESMTTTLIENTTSSATGEPPKLIIRIGKRKADAETADRMVTPQSVPETAAPTGSTAPIRLKLARVSDGGGYVIGNKKKDKQHKDRTHRNSTPTQAHGEESQQQAAISTETNSATNNRGINLEMPQERLPAESQNIPSTSNEATGTIAAMTMTKTTTKTATATAAAGAGSNSLTATALQSSEEKNKTAIKTASPAAAESATTQDADYQSAAVSSKDCTNSGGDDGLLPLNKNCEVR